VDVDEFYRYGGNEGCLLFWEDQRTKIHYTQFVLHKECNFYWVGKMENILIRR
jgi:hypothetical protein